MMEWVPYGQTIDEFKTHVRAFASVFPQVTIGVRAGRLRDVHARLGRRRSRSTTTSIQAVLGRPGVLADISSAYDSPEHTIEGWTTPDRRT